MKYKLNKNISIRKAVNETFHNNAKLNWCYTFSKYFNVDMDSASYLYNFWDANTEITFDADDDVISCTPCEALLMLAWMLVDDGFDKDMYINLGLKKYKSVYNGKNNPYDFSWFEEYDSDDNTGLQLVKKWIQSHPKQWAKIYDIVKKYINNFDSTKIFDFQYEIFG